MVQYDVDALCASISIRFSKKYYVEYMCFGNIDKHIERQKGITRRTKQKWKITL